MTENKTIENELDCGPIADDYRCEQCLYGQRNFLSPKQCIGCDGSSNLVPLPLTPSKN